MGREVDLGRRVAEEQEKRAEAERVLARNEAMIDALPDKIVRFGKDGSPHAGKGLGDTSIGSPVQQAMRPCSPGACKVFPIRTTTQPA